MLTCSLNKENNYKEQTKINYHEQTKINEKIKMFYT